VLVFGPVFQRHPQGRTIDVLATSALVPGNWLGALGGREPDDTGSMIWRGTACPSDTGRWATDHRDPGASFDSGRRDEAEPRSDDHGFATGFEPGPLRFVSVGPHERPVFCVPGRSRLVDREMFRGARDGAGGCHDRGRSVSLTRCVC